MATITELLSYQKPKVLTQEQVDSFMKYGFLKLPGAIIPEKGDEWTKNVWHRLGMDPNDKSTWHTERTNMPRQGAIEVSEIAPVAWQAICELCGGEDRIAENGKKWGDGFIVNLGSEEGMGKEVPPKELDNWHVDGDFFIHFLDSPEQALLVIPCWSDVEANGGATWICDEGPARIGRFLYDHPEGVTPHMGPRDAVTTLPTLNRFSDTIKLCPESSFHELTGKKGDVILMHPLMLHSASKNGRRLIRIITNPPVSLVSPFEFNRSNPEDYSLIELKTMQAIGGDSAPGTMFQDWKITREREAVVPARIHRQEAMAIEEQRRLKELGLIDEVTGATQAPPGMEAVFGGTAKVGA